MVSPASDSGDRLRVSRFRRIGSSPVFAAFVLLAMTIAAHWPAVHAEVLWDDIVQITDNATLHEPDALRRIWFEFEASPNYYPLLYTTFWLEYQLTDLNLPLSHGINVLLQALCAAVLWRVLKRLGVCSAWFAAALFAVHPVTVESVAWLIERKNLLSLLLFLISALMLLRLEDMSKKGQGLLAAAFSPWPTYITALLLFTAALFVKTAVVMLPPLLLVAAWWRRGRVTVADILRAAPLFLIAAVLGLITVYHEGYISVGANQARPEGFMSCLAASGWCLWFYLYKMVLPVRLSMLYPRWDVNPAFAFSWLPLLSLLAIAVVAWLRRATWGRPVLAVLIAWVIMLLPVLGISDIGLFTYSLVTDHWHYPAMWLPLALVAAMGVRLFGRIGRSNTWNIGAAVVVLATFSVMSHDRARVYGSAADVWRDAVAKDSEGWGPRYLLGLSLLNDNDLDGAIGNFRTANDIRPNDVPILCNLGGALVRDRRYVEAITHLRRAVLLAPRNTQSNYNLGSALLSQGKIDEDMAMINEAIEAFRKTLASRNFGFMVSAARIAAARAMLTDAIATWVNHAVKLGADLARQGRLDAAVRQFRMALGRDANHGQAHYFLGSVLQRQGNLNDAVEHFRHAVRVDADSVSALYRLAWILATHPDAGTRRPRQAIELAQRGVTLTRNEDPAVLDALAAAYAADGQFDKAVAHAKDALELARKGQVVDAVTAQITTRLERYQRRLPYHE